MRSREELRAIVHNITKQSIARKKEYENEDNNNILPKDIMNEKVEEVKSQPIDIPVKAKRIKKVLTPEEKKQKKEAAAERKKNRSAEDQKKINDRMALMREKKLKKK